jgi:lipid-A-disaccharide synthase
MKRLLYDNNYRTKIIKDYNRLEQLMGEPGCSKRAAEEMVALLNEK